MARLILHERQQPYMIDMGDEKAAICACGLSQNKPYCDGSHKTTRDEEDGVVYRYEGDARDGQRSPIES